MLKSMKLNAETKILFFIVLFAVFVLVVPHLLRYYNGDTLLTGDKAFYYHRISEDIKNNFRMYDYLNNKTFYPFGWPLFLALIGFLTRIDTEILGLVIPVLLGVFSLILFYKILCLFKVDQLKKIVSSLILIVSPPFIFLFGTSNEHSMPIFLSLLAFYFFLMKKERIAVLLIILVSLFSWYLVFVIFLTSMLYVILRSRERFSHILKRFFVIIIFGFLIQLPFFLKFGFPDKINFSVLDTGFNYAFQRLIFVFGGSYGVGSFALLLGIVAIITSWKEKSKYSLIFISSILFITLAFYKLELIFYFTFVLSFLAALGLFNIMTAVWESKLIRDLTVIIFICGLLFSGVSFINELNQSEPNENTIKGLVVLKEAGDGLVFSHYSLGALISDFTGKSVLLDSSFLYTKDLNNKWSDSITLLNSRNLGEAKIILDKYNIRYIFITRKMKQGLVWNEEDDGLLFLLRFSKSFNNLYSFNDVEIWEYVKEGAE